MQSDSGFFPEVIGRRCDETTLVYELQVARDHDFFEGHFPGNPIVPGFALLAWMFKLLEAEPDYSGNEEPPNISSVKFLSPARPGDTLRLEIRRSKPLRYTFVYLRGADEVVARGKFNDTRAQERPERVEDAG